MLGITKISKQQQIEILDIEHMMKHHSKQPIIFTPQTPTRPIFSNTFNTTLALFSIFGTSNCKRFMQAEASSQEEADHDFYVFLLFGIVFGSVIFFLLYLAVKNKAFEKFTKNTKKEKTHSKNSGIKMDLENKAAILKRKSSGTGKKGGYEEVYKP